MTVGVVFGSITPPERIARVARLAEDLGFGELWFSEDCYFSGGMAGVAQILASTDRIPVGTGAVSAVTRHPAITAMEFAGLARMYPGRVRPGVALGVRHWLRQMDLLPAKPLTALHETVTVLRELFAGKEVSFDGTAHRLDRIMLDQPPRSPCRSTSPRSTRRHCGCPPGSPTGRSCRCSPARRTCGGRVASSDRSTG
jgi:alkanesulfonate monooxygenase SsuD/methylene tetrahydromethanopterin reductase-like flavin-dependent oxidoreductase (luciferase family)